MGEYRNECCEPPKDKCRHDCCQPCCNDSGNGLTILILLIVLYFLFCGNDKGGLFGGLF